MSLPPRLAHRAWIFALLIALGFVGWSDYRRAQRVDTVTNTDREEAIEDASSPTGYVGGKRWLIVPEHHNRSYQWIAETQQMLAKKEWRVRQIDTENSPAGREVHAASPYHWWLALVAWCDHSLNGHAYGLAVERAALWAEPLLHLFLLVSSTIFVARQFGSLPASLIALGITTLYPFAGSFLPGVPDDQSLSRITALWSLLPLLAAIVGIKYAVTENVRSSAKAPTAHPPQTDESNSVALDRRQQRSSRLFFVGGVAGGLGLWISVAHQIPILGGIAFGGILAAWLASRGGKSQLLSTSASLPWRAWALGGAVTSLAAYLIEYFPAHLDLRLQVNHPLYGLAWLGLGEFLTLMSSWLSQGKSYWNRGRALHLMTAISAVMALPVALKLSGTAALLSGDPLSARLSSLPNGVVAQNVSAWIQRDGLTAPLIATCLPLLVLGAAVWFVARRQTDSVKRAALALVLGPVTATLLLASTQLSWWVGFDAMWLALLIPVTPPAVASLNPPRGNWLWLGFAGVIFLTGLIQLLPPPAPTAGNNEFTRLEAEGLIERALAHWIADHAGPEGAVILSPPDRTTSWCFHGGLRGLGTANWENRDGLAATIRIVSATTADEALALLNQHGITHIILPSWDSDLDEFARWTLGRADDAFIMAMHRWSLPPWLRPLPYGVPSVPGFEDQSVVILAVTDESNPAAATGRLAEYFLETKQLELATAAIKPLQRYPSDLGAIVALAQIEKARGNTPAFTALLDALVSNLASGSDRSLAWDRRVSMAIVLAQGQRTDLAREQVRRCLDKLTEARLRSLTTGSLFRLQVLTKALELKISDAHLNALALKLLPEELRARL